MELVPVKNLVAASELIEAVAQPVGAISVDEASVIIEEEGKRYRLPKNLEYENSESATKFGVARVCREVATERDLLNVHGTFYELPARNAQGLSKIRQAMPETISRVVNADP